MKKKSKEEIRNKTIPEIESEIDKIEKEIIQLNIDIQMGKVKNTSLKTRKQDDLAVLKTILKEKRLLEKAISKRSKNESL